MKKTLLAIALIAAASAAQAQSAPNNVPTYEEKPLRFFVGAGITFGGDTLATVTYTDGTKDDVTAGGIIQIDTGLDYRFGEQFSAQASIGYHVNDTRAAKNGGVTFSRVPVELVGYYHLNDQWRLGVGGRYITGGKLKGNGAASSIQADYKNTNGVLVEAEYFSSPKLGIKVRFVKEEYEEIGLPGKIDGSHVGIFASYYF